MRFKHVYVCGGLLLATALSGCATSEKVQPEQIGDTRLSCDGLLAETAKVDAAENEVKGNKGVTGTNVAAALLWLPGLAYTYYDAGQAEQLIQQRRSYLANLYDKKGCR